MCHIKDCYGLYDLVLTKNNLHKWVSGLKIHSMK